MSLGYTAPGVPQVVPLKIRMQSLYAVAVAYSNVTSFFGEDKKR